MTVFATLANQSGGNVRPSPGEAASFNSPGPPAYLERPRAPRRLPGVQAKGTPHDQEKKAPPSSDRAENIALKTRKNPSDIRMEIHEWRAKNIQGRGLGGRMSRELDSW